MTAGRGEVVGVAFGRTLDKLLPTDPAQVVRHMRGGVGWASWVLDQGPEGAAADTVAGPSDSLRAAHITRPAFVLEIQPLRPTRSGRHRLGESCP